MNAAITDLSRASDLDRVLNNPEQVRALRAHLDELASGAAFRGSHRSQQFLRHIIEKVFQGSADQLKERTIGIELFHRSPAYDTGEDAIVRVTASDVRRRLLQHYGRYGETACFRILLPPGSYVPEIECTPVAGATPDPPHPPTPAPTRSDKVAPTGQASSSEAFMGARTRWYLIAAGVALGMLMATTALAFHPWRSSITAEAVLPWRSIFRPGHSVQLITSDPSLEHLQEITGSDISLSDYANRKYVPSLQALTPAQQQFYQFYLYADNASAVDTPLAVNIARLAPASVPFKVRSARTLRVADMQTGDNLILIGSPRSNPWFDFFENQLDFRFVFSKDLNQEVIQNIHPLPGERTTYSPTARGFATGESFAIIALVQNPNQSGQVLLLAGADGEGTEAAGHLVTDLPHLQRAVNFCEIPPGVQLQNFELLVRLSTMAGSPSTVDMVACHRLTALKAS
jgi:S-layer like family, C-terminal region